MFYKATTEDILPPQELLPPPPPVLASDLPHILKADNYNNEGIGSMEAYLLFRKQKLKDVNDANDVVNDVDGHTHNDNVVETGIF